MNNENEQKIIITITGADKIGIVAQITAALANCETNIEDIRQSIMQGCFSMMMLCDITNAKKSFKEIRDEIINVAKSLDMEIWVQRKEIFDKMHTI